MLNIYSRRKKPVTTVEAMAEIPSLLRNRPSFSSLSISCLYPHRLSGVGKSYISMILNGEKAPKNAETRLNAAFYAVLNRKLEEEKHAKNKV